MKRPGRAGAAALGGAIALWGGLLVGAVTVDVDGFRSGPPPGLQETGAAEALLRDVAGTPPVACELVLRALGNRWGASPVRPRVHEPLGPSAAQRATAEWAWMGRPHEDDARPLLDGLDSPDPCVARVAAKMLRVMDDPDLPAAVRERVRSAVGERARSGRGPARLAALAALAGLDGPAAGETLEAALEDSDPAVRRAAAWALGDGGTHAAGRAVEALGRALDSDDPALRENAAWALGRIESRTALPVLVRALGDATVGVRVNAALALGEIEDEGAIPPLSSLLTSDGDPEVRRAAAWALGRIEQ